MNHRLENWAAADIYENYMGRWSQEVAPHFLARLHPQPGLAWLDVGCGTGVLTRAIAHEALPRTLVGLDPSPGFLGFARDRQAEAHFLAADGRAFPLHDESFDMVVSGLALNFIPDSAQAVAEMRRVVRPGGTVAAYVWDYAGKMEFLRYFWDAAVATDSAAAELHEAARFPICEPDALRRLWHEASLQQVQVDAIEVPTAFASFEVYWSSFLAGHFPSPKYVASLDAAQRARLRERLRADVPTDAGGSIRLVARAWVVVGAR